MALCRLTLQNEFSPLLKLGWTKNLVFQFALTYNRTTALESVLLILLLLAALTLDLLFLDTNAVNLKHRKLLETTSLIQYLDQALLSSQTFHRAPNRSATRVVISLLISASRQELPQCLKSRL